jgi:hypothetical protein
MAETLVENRVCNACGADVRPGSLFCYNCGKSVVPEPLSEDNHKKDNIVKIRPLEDISVDGERQDKLKQEEIEKIEVEKSAESLNETFTKKPVRTEVLEPVKLKSAANLRRKSKVLPKKKVEIVWEKQENTPNLWFIIVALILTIFAVVIILLAMYIR